MEQGVEAVNLGPKLLNLLGAMCFGYSNIQVKFVLFKEYVEGKKVQVDGKIQVASEKANHYFLTELGKIKVEHSNSFSFFHIFQTKNKLPLSQFLFMSGLSNPN